jgi:acylphosphatase
MVEKKLIRRIVVKGRVQGLGYREFTRRTAERLGVAGWVRNRPDGAVEALLHGRAGDVEALIAEMRRGPRMAAVMSLSVSEHSEAPDDEGTFAIHPTF